MATAKSKRQKILKYMKHWGEITQRDAIGFGCLRLASQIFELKKAGIEIYTEYRDVKNQDGSTSRIAAYSLLHPESIQTCTECGKLFVGETCLCKDCAKKVIQDE